MAEIKTSIFKEGIVNYPNDPELVPRGGASDSLAWITSGAFIELSKIKAIIGSLGSIGSVKGHHVAYKNDGTAVQYRKVNTKIQYLNGSTWTDVITGLTASEQYSFANYTSLAGSFVYISGYDGLYKINVANPASYLNLTDETLNFKHPGKILISDSRMFMWDLPNDKSGLYLSYIDPENYSLSNGNVAYGTIAGNTVSGTITPYNSTTNITAVQASGAIGSLKSISNITQSFTNTNINAVAHGFVAGDYVLFSNLGTTLNPYFTGTGTITSAGVSVVGTGTSFTTQLLVGSHIYVGSNAYTVATITDNTHMTLTNNLTCTNSAWQFISTYQLNNILVKVGSVTDADNFIIPINSTTYEKYSSGGKVAKAEVFTDNNNGGLTSQFGGTGTINYITGAISTTFNQTPINGQQAVASYLIEGVNPTIATFTYSTPRQPGQGDVFRQDEGGDSIQKVENFEGIFYSIKERSVYQLALSADDTSATNTMYRRNIGMPYFRASISTGQGIVFMDTANPDQPKLTRLERNVTGVGVLPVELAPQFDFSQYNWDKCAMEGIGDYIIFTGRTLTGSANDRIFLYSLKWKSIDVLPFNADTFVKDSGMLYIGDSTTDTVYNLFNGFGSISNQWTSGADLLGSEELKRERRITFAGNIATAQSIEVYLSTDDDTFTLIGTISGSGSYVETTGRQVGNIGLGLGGGTLVTIYPYTVEFKVSTPKFYQRRLKFIATGTGYASVSVIKDKEIDGYGSKVPSKFRTN